MKKLVLTILMVLIPTFALAGPFLTCDPQPNVTEYRVYLNAVDMGTSAAKLDTESGDYVLWYDLSSIAEGSFSAEATAINEWGESAKSAPFGFTKALPGSPINVRVSSE